MKFTASQIAGILEGEVDLVIFEEDGSIREVIRMGALPTNQTFFYRLSKSIYHMFIIRSEFLVFHEATEGPFKREDTIFPEWSPPEESIILVDFINLIESKIYNKPL